jgi:tRNA G18 (ribose-2'-O)-methylase SpoU
MIVTRLDDQSDDLLADYRNIPDPVLVAQRGLFVAEGRLVVTRLLTSSAFTARSAMVTETALAAMRDVFARQPQLPVYVVPQPVMNGVAGFNIHRGCLAIGERPAPRHWRAPAAAARHLAVLEQIGDADNVGAVFRNSAAFGIDAVLLGPSCADPLYRKAIRTSMGSALSIPFAQVEPWPAALHELRADGWQVIAMTPAPAARPLREVAAATQGHRCAVVLGHEGDGLTAAALDACTYRARIPMAAGVDSLNIATAAALAFYELA